MRGFNRVSRRFLTGGMLAVSALVLSSCGNYALYKIHVTTSAKSSIPAPGGQPASGSERSDINECEMTITDENGVPVLEHFILKYQATVDNQGNEVFKGCQNGKTSADLGLFSYSTSRTSGTLKFRVDGLSDGVGDGRVRLQTGESGDIAPQTYPPEMPQVNIAMQ